MNCSGIGCPVEHESFASAQSCNHGWLGSLGTPPRKFIVSPELAEAAERQLQKDERQARAEVLENHRARLIDYLRLKFEAEDWHGVQDAASDLRDLDNELDGLRY